MLSHSFLPSACLSRNIPVDKSETPAAKHQLSPGLVTERERAEAVYDHRSEAEGVTRVKTWCFALESKCIVKVVKEILCFYLISVKIPAYPLTPHFLANDPEEAGSSRQPPFFSTPSMVRIS